MSLEQKEDFHMESMVVLSMIVWAGAVGALVLLMLLMVLITRNDQRQKARKRDTEQKQRLRYVGNKELVRVKELLPDEMWPSYLQDKRWLIENQVGPFHLFLSHNWAQVCLPPSQAHHRSGRPKQSLL